MPATKNQLQRYLILDKLFRNPNGHYRFYDLLDVVNEEMRLKGFDPISERTLHEDINIMRSEDKGFGVKLKHWFEGKERIYQYEKLSFSIMKMPLTLKQRKQLGSTLQMLSHLRGLPNYRWLDETLVLLKEEFGVKDIGVGSVHFQQCDKANWLELFMPLYEVVKEPKVIAVKYHRFGRPSRERIVHPYQLKQYNNRWYLVGLEERLRPRCKYAVLALDRIEGFRILKDESFIPANIEDVENYYRGIVGVSRLPEGFPMEIRIKAYYPAAWYLGTKPLHKSQEPVEKGKDFVTYKLTVMENEELVQQLLVYADQIEILEGEWIKKKLVERAKAILKRNHELNE